MLAPLFLFVLSEWLGYNILIKGYVLYSLPLFLFGTFFLAIWLDQLINPPSCWI